MPRRNRIKPAYPTLREYLKAEGVSQDAFAKLVGIKQPQISKVVNGKGAVSLRVAARIAEYANVPVTSLLRRSA